MNRLVLSALSLTLIGVAACSNDEPDAVQVAPGAPATEVADTTAQTAANSAALALGMTRAELEDADLISPEPEFRDLGDVESLVLDAGGQVTGFVIDLEGIDIDVIVPIADVSSVRRQDDVDLTTALTQAQLQALPPYTGPDA